MTPLPHKQVSLAYIILPSLILGLDQALKQARDTVSTHLNTAAAFNIPISNTVIVLLSIAVLVCLGRVIFFTEKPLHGPLLLIFASGMSNLIDRLRLGATIDYIILGSGIYNLADLIILISIFLIIFNLFDLHSRNGHPSPILRYFRH